MRLLADPCSSCPYRADHPSGVWSVDDYEKLTRFAEPPDGGLPDALSVFLCHHSRLGFREETACKGWATVESDSIAMRLALARETLDPTDVFDTPPTVAVFESGARAAENGMRDIDHPRRAALKMAANIRTKAHRAGVQIDD